MKRRAVRDPLLLEIAAAVGAGRITMQSIRHADEFIAGVTFSDGSIVVNPIPETVDTVCHEAIHRMRPAWSETTVRRKTTQLMRQMSYDEIETLYTLVVATAQPKRGALTLKRSRRR